MNARMPCPRFNCTRSDQRRRHACPITHPGAPAARRPGPRSPSRANPGPPGAAGGHPHLSCVAGFPAAAGPRPVCLDIPISFPMPEPLSHRLGWFRGRRGSRARFIINGRSRGRVNKGARGGPPARAPSVPAFGRLSFLSRAEGPLGDERSRLWIWKINRNLPSLIFLFARCIIFSK